MDLFEYQGKQFFSKYGLPVSSGEITFTVEEAVEAVSDTVEAAVEGVSNVVESIKDAVTGEDDEK